MHFVYLFVYFIRSVVAVVVFMCSVCSFAPPRALPRAENQEKTMHSRSKSRFPENRIFQVSGGILNRIWVVFLGPLASPGVSRADLSDKEWPNVEKRTDLFPHWTPKDALSSDWALRDTKWDPERLEMGCAMLPKMLQWRMNLSRNTASKVMMTPSSIRIPSHTVGSEN